MVSLPAPVADLPRDGQRLLVVVDGCASLAQAVVGSAQVAQVGPLPAPVSHLLGDSARLLVIRDGRAYLAQGGVGQAQAVQPGAFVAPVFQGARGRQPSFAYRQPLPRVAKKLEITVDGPGQVLHGRPRPHRLQMLNQRQRVRPRRRQRFVSLRPAVPRLLHHFRVMRGRPRQRLLWQPQPLAGVGVDQGVAHLISAAPRLQQSVRHQFAQRPAHIVFVAAQRRCDGRALHRGQRQPAEQGQHVPRRRVQHAHAFL